VLLSKKKKRGSWPEVIDRTLQIISGSDGDEPPVTPQMMEEILLDRRKKGAT